MMSIPLSKEIIRKAREMVLCGQSKHSVAKELGIGITTIYKYTKDIQSGKCSRKLTEKTIQQIREEVIKGRSKYQIAKEMKVGFQLIYYYTKDLPNHQYPERGIQGKTLELLKKLLQEGYIISNEENYARLQRLKKYLPMIERAEIKRRSVYYLSDKNKVALQSMIKSNKSKVFSYQELSSMSKVFDIKLSKKEKKSVLSQKKR